MTIQPGPGYTFNASSLGTNISIQQPWSEWDSSTELFPLWTKLKDDKVSVVPGTVNRIVPVIGTDYLDASTPPTITVSGEGYVCIKLTYVASTFFPRTSEIIFHAGTSTPADTTTEGYYPLAKVNSVTVGSTTTYSLIILSYGNFVCNRLKSGANPAVWYWSTITPQPGA